MKAERIQNQLPEIPGWRTEALLTAERQLQLPSFLDACRFALQVAERTHPASGDNTPWRSPQIDIRQGHVTLRVAAEDPRFLDAELQLIDELSRLVEVMKAGPAMTGGVAADPIDDLAPGGG